MSERAPYQVPVMPFRRTADGIEYAALRRSDDGHWQGIAGGGEGNETPAEAAGREGMEEAGLRVSTPIYLLDTRCSVARDHFPGGVHWHASIFVVTEHAFAADCTGLTLQLSAEHGEVFWGSFEAISSRLRWDSNRTALWELRERLARNALISVFDKPAENRQSAK